MSDASELTEAVQLMEPPVSDEAIPFWDATRDRRLVVPWCTACRRPFWYPRSVCPGCVGEDFEWRPAGGTAVVYAASVHHRPGPGRDAAAGPYVVALVELPEGIRMMANIVGEGADAVAVGDAVQLTWHPLSDGRHLPQFTASAQGDGSRGRG